MWSHFSVFCYVCALFDDIFNCLRQNYYHLMESYLWNGNSIFVETEWIFYGKVQTTAPTKNYAFNHSRTLIWWKCLILNSDSLYSWYWSIASKMFSNLTNCRGTISSVVNLLTSISMCPDVNWRWAIRKEKELGRKQ